jgi:hypothetical protein
MPSTRRRRQNRRRVYRMSSCSSSLRQRTPAMSLRLRPKRISRIPAQVSRSLGASRAIPCLTGARKRFAWARLQDDTIHIHALVPLDPLAASKRGNSIHDTVRQNVRHKPGQIHSRALSTDSFFVEELDCVWPNCWLCSLLAPPLVLPLLVSLPHSPSAGVEGSRGCDSWQRGCCEPVPP